MNPVWAILPIKSLDDAKQRLRGRLSAEERRQFMISSISDVMGEIAKSTALSGLLVVSKDPVALALARDHHAQQLEIDSDNGQSDAITRGVAYLEQRGVLASVTIPGDTPLVKADDIDAVCTSLHTPSSLTLVSNSDHTGTNCIAAARPNLIPYQFGRNSMSRHLASAQSVGIRPTLLRLPRLQLDIDTPQDIAAVMQLPVSTTAQRFLVSLGMDRLGKDLIAPPQSKVTPAPLAVKDQ